MTEDWLLTYRLWCHRPQASVLAEPPGRPWRRAVSATDLSALGTKLKTEGAPVRPGAFPDGKGEGGVGGGGGLLPESVGELTRRRWMATLRARVLPPSYALLAHHARAAGQHIRAAAYYLASAKQSSLDLCLRNGMVSPFMMYESTPYSAFYIFYFLFSIL